MISRILRTLRPRSNNWSFPMTAEHSQYDNNVVTYVTCVNTGEVRLCHPSELYIFSAREDRKLRADLAPYLKAQQDVACKHAQRYQQAWDILHSEPRAMERRNASMAVVADTGL